MPGASSAQQRSEWSKEPRNVFSCFSLSFPPCDQLETISCLPEQPLGFSHEQYSVRPKSQDYHFYISDDSSIWMSNLNINLISLIFIITPRFMNVRDIQFIIGKKKKKKNRSYTSKERPSFQRVIWNPQAPWYPTPGIQSKMRSDTVATCHLSVIPCTSPRIKHVQSMMSMKGNISNASFTHVTTSESPHWESKLIEPINDSFLIARLPRNLVHLSLCLPSLFSTQNICTKLNVFPSSRAAPMLRTINSEHAHLVLKP